MKHLKIKEIGPVTAVEIDLNKVNVIIGPQSSGKSTICKIACFCVWVEKRVSLQQSFDWFLEKENFENGLIRFHKLKGFLREESEIMYESDIFRFSYSHKEGIPNFEWKEDRYSFKKSKISYIPAERNLVSVIPNWLEVKFEENNILDFMISWNDAREIYTAENPLSILDLGIQYYYDENSRKDVVVVNQKEKTLDLTNTSSGLQSIIPLQTVIEYLIKNIYEYVSMSVEEIQEKSRLNRIIESKFKKRPIKLDPSKSLDILTTEYIEQFGGQENYLAYMNILGNFVNLQFTQLFLEEPELNIFPLAQRDMVYWLLRAIQTRDEDTLFFTTHSPFILNALNNCLLGYLVKNGMEEEEKTKLKSYGAWIDPKQVSAYEVTEQGTLRSIQSKRGTIAKHYFNRVNSEMMDEYYELLEFLDEEA